MLTAILAATARISIFVQIKGRKAWVGGGGMSKKSETPVSRANAHKHALILLKGAMSHVAAA